ncbi:hypothetical protein BDF19DRAFT_448933 [Syncephalis fuscata]|nr:hypothetical protein BDF19DRAFT_448933 [Syncephalis fuscata]
MPKLLKAPVRLAKSVSRTVKRIFGRKKSSSKTTTAADSLCTNISGDINAHHHTSRSDCHEVNNLLPTSLLHNNTVEQKNNATTTVGTSLSRQHSVSKRKTRTDGRILSWWRRLRGKGVKRGKPLSRSPSFRALPSARLSINNASNDALQMSRDSDTTDLDNHMAIQNSQSQFPTACHDQITFHLSNSRSPSMPSDKLVSSSSSVSSVSSSIAKHGHSTVLSRLSFGHHLRSNSKRKRRKAPVIITNTSSKYSSQATTPTSSLGFPRFGQAVAQVRDSMDSHYSDQERDYIGMAAELLPSESQSSSYDGQSKRERSQKIFAHNNNIYDPTAPYTHHETVTNLIPLMFREEDQEMTLLDSRRASSVAPAVPATPARSSSIVVDTSIDEHSEFLSTIPIGFSNLLLDQKNEKKAVELHTASRNPYNYDTSIEKKPQISNIEAATNIECHKMLLPIANEPVQLVFKETQIEFTLETERFNEAKNISIGNNTELSTVDDLLGDTLVERKDGTSKLAVDEIFTKELVLEDNLIDNSSITKLLPNDVFDDPNTPESNGEDIQATDEFFLHDAVPMNKPSLQRRGHSMPCISSVYADASPILRLQRSFSMDWSDSIKFNFILDQDMDTTVLNIDIPSNDIATDQFNLANTFMTQLESAESKDKLLEAFYLELVYNTDQLSILTDPDEVAIGDFEILKTDDCPESPIVSEILKDTFTARETALNSNANTTTTTSTIERSVSAPEYSALPPRPRRFIRRINSQGGGLRSLPTNQRTNNDGHIIGTYKALHQRAHSASDALLGCLSQIVTATAEMPRIANSFTVNDASLTTSTTATTTSVMDDNSIDNNNNINNNSHQTQPLSIANSTSIHTANNHQIRQRTTIENVMCSDTTQTTSSAPKRSQSGLKTSIQSLVAASAIHFLAFLWVCLVIIGICLRVASAGVVFGPSYLAQLGGFICRTIGATFALW